MNEYPPGTFGYEMAECEAKVERLPWHLRWFWRRRVRRVRENYERRRDESLARWFREHW